MTDPSRSRRLFPVSGRKDRPAVVAALTGTALVVIALAVVGPLAMLRWAQRSQAEASQAEVIGVNRLGAATLDIEIGRVTTMLGTVDLAPGDTTIGSVEVSNAGSLPLRYRMTVSGGDGPLRPWLHWTTWVESASCAEDGPASAQQLTDDREDGPTDPGTPKIIGPRVLAPGVGDVLCIAAQLSLSTPNTVQGTDLSVELVADAEHAVEGGEAGLVDPGG